MREDTDPDLKRTGQLPLVLQRISDGVLTLTLNRPEKLNSLDSAMVEALHVAIDMHGDHKEVRTIIVAGAGSKAFVAGADIEELRERRRDQALAGINSELFDRIAGIPVPTIASIRGYALGGGCELAIACDIRVAAESAKIGQPETGLGIMAAAGATYRLPPLVGLGMAREMLYSGRIVGAEEALRIGLFNRVVPDEQLVAVTEKLAKRIARNDPLANRLTKAALSARFSADNHSARIFENVAQAVLFESPEKFRRMGDFLERKKNQ